MSVRRRGPSRRKPEALQLFGIFSREGRPVPQGSGATTVEYRDLAGVVRTVPFQAIQPTEDRVAEYRDVVESAFGGGAVIPAPFGTVFRNRESLLRWLELHYFTLADALRYLHDRQVVRVRVAPAATHRPWDTMEQDVRGADIQVAAFDSFRVLRKQAVAFVPVPLQARPSESGAEAAFLVERERWNAFLTLIKEEQRRLPDFRFEQSGPWPAYDFVRLDLNA